MADRESLSCPICHELLDAAIVTSCGHSFCAKCLLDYWRTTGVRAVVKCPMDRQPVSFMVPNGLLRAQVAGIVRNADDVPPADAQMIERFDDEAASYNQQFALLPRGLPQEVREGIAIYRNLPDNNRTKWIINMLIFAVLLYAFLPWDLLPDSLGFVGYIDDFFTFVVLIGIAFMMLNSMRQAMVEASLNRPH